MKIKQHIIAAILNTIYYLVPHKKKETYLAGDEEFLTQESIEELRLFKKTLCKDK